MNERVDVAVLGVGGFGSACLAHLARRGADVLGLDAFLPGHDRGSSHGDTRIIRQAYFEHSDYVPLMQRAYGQWSELEAESGRSLMNLCGLTAAGLPEGEAIPGSRLAVELHGAELQNLTPQDVEDRLPGFEIPAGFEVVYEPPAGFLYVDNCVRAHVDSALQAGARLRIGERITGWSSDGQTARVETDGGIIEAGTLVVTAGAWASSLLADIPEMPPICVRRKVLLWHPVRTADYSIDDGCSAFYFEMPEGIFYGFPSLDGKTLKIAEHTGGQVVEDPLQLDRRLLPEDVAPVSQFLERVMPGVDPKPVRHAVCMYSMTPDSHFIVDRHPEFANVIIGAGFSGHGFKFTPVIAEALADLALEGSTELPIGFLRLSRFGMR